MASSITSRQTTPKAKTSLPRVFPQASSVLPTNCWNFAFPDAARLMKATLIFSGWSPETSVPSFVLFELSTVMARILRWPQASQPLAYHSSRMSPPPWSEGGHRTGQRSWRVSPAIMSHYRRLESPLLIRGAAAMW